MWLRWRCGVHYNRIRRGNRDVEQVTWSYQSVHDNTCPQYSIATNPFTPSRISPVNRKGPIHFPWPTGSPLFYDIIIVAICCSCDDITTTTTTMTVSSIGIRLKMPRAEWIVVPPWRRLAPVRRWNSPHPSHWSLVIQQWMMIIRTRPSDFAFTEFKTSFWRWWMFTIKL